MAQRWHDLLFAHWPISTAALRPLIPPTLEIDTFDNSAWLSVVPFQMSGIRPRGLFPVPWLSAFAELNVRTYVRTIDRGILKPGVFFFSLDAANPVAVATARTWFKLPYFNANMRCDLTAKGVNYESHRTHRNAPPANFRAHYEPIAPVALAKPNTLEHWLTERYCLYTAHANSLYIGEIHHEPWPVQQASAHIETNTMAAAAGLTLTGEPLLQFARSIDVAIWPLRKVT
jgi:uncharacterized protein YqjF (DUF2071 family)